MPVPRHRLSLLFGLALLAALATGHAYSQRGAEPGRFDYYVLVLGWTPSYCITEGRSRRDRQCASERPHAFTLHGLWPQNAEGWPEECKMRKRPWVPQSVIDDMRDIMPSKNLVIHEYRAHGTCSGLEPAQYFGLARDLYERVSIPPRFSGTDRGLRLEVGLQAGPGLALPLDEQVPDPEVREEPRLGGGAGGSEAGVARGPLHGSEVHVRRQVLAPDRHERVRVDAVAVVTASQPGRDTATLELHTTTSGGGQLEARYGDFLVKLGALSPQPRSTERIRAEDYRATLRVAAVR